MPKLYIRLISIIFLSVATAHISVAQVARNNQRTGVPYKDNYQRIGGGPCANTAFEMSGGGLSAWGDNSSGQTGTGTKGNILSPKKLNAGNEWVLTSAGKSHAVGIKANGTLWGWGSNDFGQTGTGTANMKPVQIGTSDEWVAIAAGENFTIALKVDGSLWAWGDNSKGQCGSSSSAQINSPARIGNTNDWKSISAGKSHALALKANGTLWSWGENKFGQIGNHSTGDISSPVEISALGEWSWVNCGQNSSYALKADGTLWAWGDNTDGQLGTGNTENFSSAIQRVGNDNTWTMISGGGAHALALKANGTLWSWGSNDKGQSGKDFADRSNVPVQSGNSHKWVSVQAFSSSSAVLAADGTISLFGNNESGLLAAGDTELHSGFTLQTAAADDWMKLSAGYNHTLALKNNGTIWGWGGNTSGQLGIGTTVGKTSPVQIGTDADWVAISAGGSFSLGLKSNGTVWSWGSNSDGQLGNSSATPLVPVQVGTATDWASISAGYYHSAALKASGVIWSWGHNAQGQLGNGTNTASAVPVQASPVNLWLSVSCGGDHTSTLRSNGTPWAAGWNAFGELGTGNNTQQNNWIQSTGGIATATAVCGGGGFTMVRLSSGALKTYGWNTSGQLGDGSNTTSNIPVNVSGISTSVQITAKWQHAHTVLADGTVRGWGLNTGGSLGDGTVNNRTSPVAASGLVNVVELGGNELGSTNFDGVIRASRREYCMTGTNSSGQLGDGTTTTRNTYGCTQILSGPANINNGIELWLDGSNVNNTSPATNPANGTGVTTWKDISGNSNNATVLTGQNTPTMSTSQINGKDVMHFNRTSQVLGSVYNVPGVDLRSSAMPQSTIFTVYRQGAAAAGDWHGIWGDDDGLWDRFFMSRFGTNNGIVSVGPPTNNIAVPNAGTIGDTKLLTAVYDYGVANGSTIYYNALPVQSVTDRTDPTAAQTTLRIGWDGDDNPLNGDIAEMVAYNRKLTDCEIIAVNRYFGYKYGVNISTTTVTPSNAVFCPGGSVVLTGNSPRTGVSWQWLLGGAPIGGATSATYTATAAGNYQVIASLGGCSDTSAIRTVKELFPRLYVNSSIATSGNGSSWATAMKTVNEALDVANNGTCASQIWVKSGTYYPMLNDYTTVSTNVDSSFRILRNNIKLYGGFAGTETSVGQRNISVNPTILSGDIGVAGDSLDNIRHIITIIPASGATIDTSSTRVDGFTITRANCYNGTGTFSVNGQSFNNTDGGGIYIGADGATFRNSPSIVNCTFSNNSADYGAGIYMQSFNDGTVKPVIDSCSFMNNHSRINGGAVMVYNGGTVPVTEPIIRRSNFTGNVAESRGSGIGAYSFVGTGGSYGLITVADCVFMGNSQVSQNFGDFGGAVAVSTKFNTIIKRSGFSSNTANYGAAISLYVAGSLTVDTCTFTDNKSPGAGGAVSLYGLTTASFKGCSFTGNKALYGGAVNIDNNPTTAINFDYCTFSNDTATSRGGAIRFGASNTITNIRYSKFLNNYSGDIAGACTNDGLTSNGSFLQCIFFGNKALNSGGALVSNNNQNVLMNCVLANNSTTRAAGAGGGALYAAAGTFTLHDVTASNNSTASSASPNSNTIGAAAGGTVISNNSIIWGAAANQISGPGTITNAYCNIKGLAAAGTNISQDPLFINAADPDGPDNIWGTADDGLLLMNCSPSINAGSNALIPVAVTADITTGPRIIQTIVDQGAYENTFVTPPTQTVTVAITNGAQTICAGTSVTFTATPNNAGTTPVYQWQVNGVNAGTNSNVFTSATLNNNDIVTVQVTSSLVCVLPKTVTSTGIQMTVTSAIAPAVSIAITTGSQTTCAGSSVTFTATPVNGGTTPTYQWLVNGLNAGLNQPTFTSTTLNNNDVVTVMMTSSSSCASPASATSTGITMSIGAAVAPAVSIAITAGNQTTCAGSSVTFTATTTNGGATPSYHWLVNGLNAGLNQPTFTSTTLNNNDVVTVVLTSSSSCASPTTATSTGITMSISAVVAPAVSIAITAGNQTTCAGSSVTFTATPTNGGATPAYQWQVNGLNAGLNQPTFTSTTLNDNDIVTVVMTSSSSCASPASATSTGITMTITALVTPSVSVAITAGSQNTCTGSSVTFTATPTNGGTTPAYQWQVNGLNAGTNQPTFTSTTLNNNDVVTVVMTSSSSCASPTTATSAGITMTINALSPAGVTVSATQTSICTGTNVTFTATPSNGGSSPSYQWQVNGINAGTNSDIFSTATLNNNDIVTVILTSNSSCASPTTATSTGITITVASSVIPSVSIAITTGAQIICAGSSVTFTATPVNGGAAPSYQWQVNGVNAGLDQPTFTSTTLNNNDIVTVILTSNAGCLTSNNVTSNPITMTVNPMFNPSVSIAITTGAQNICSGTSVTFTATPTDGGTTPVYQWQVNGVNAGTNSNVFTSATLNNNDIVTVIMNSSQTCVISTAVTSNQITMTVNAFVTPSVTVNASQTTTCIGNTVTFTAVPTNGGSFPVYQWQVNGINAGTNSNTFSSATLNNNDVVTVILTNNDPCVNTTTATSAPITMTVTAIIVPSVSIAITTGTQITCSGNPITFTANAVNGGTAPVYQWQINGVNAGTNSNTFTSSTLADNDIITVDLTSNAGCAIPPTVTSNSIQMTVNTTATPTISITPSQSSICIGATVLFTATISNGGSSPYYQWQVNGVNAGTNNASFASSSLVNGDIVTCILSSSLPCATIPVLTSNAITITVNNIITPSVSITASSNNICVGSSVTFTATGINAGTSPSYQWQVNGFNVGTNSATFTSNTLTNGDQVKVRLTTSALCAQPNNVLSNIITMNVNTPVTPSVSIVASTTVICAGSNVTFTATPVNGGSLPAYQWRVNGINAGTNSPSFSTTTLANNDIVTVVMTSNEACITVTNVSSNQVQITVNPLLTPTANISITAGAQTICAGTSVTFTATITNGGTTPFYQWQVNGINTGTNSTTFTSATLNNNDVVTVVLTSSVNCLAINNVSSNGITMTVNPNLTPVVNITASSTNICAGSSATFTAVPVNGGTSPSYQWQVNGINAGTNSATFTTNTLVNADVISVILTSNAGCLVSNNAMSNSIPMTVNPNLTPSVAITASSSVICAGSSATFTAVPVNGGSAPVYQWKINGINAGTNSPAFTAPGLVNGDVVSVVLTSNETCLATNNVTSNAITMTVNPLLTPTVSIAITLGSSTMCSGSPVTFTATPVNGGGNPFYQWQVNGSNAGTNSPSFTNSFLQNGDVITVIMTSNETCLASNNPVSNAITMNVTPSVTPSVTISTPQTNICAGATAVFTATPVNGGTSPVYHWKLNNTNIGTNSPTFTYSSFATNDLVTLVMTSSLGCVTTNNVVSNAIRITTATNPVVTVSAEYPEILAGGGTQLYSTVSETVTNYSWTPGFSLNNPSIATPIASPDQNTLYKLEVTSVYGCKGSATVSVKIGKGLDIANTFTPNNDGIHDFWEIKNLETYPDCKVKVFTRMGQLIFESRGYKKPWDGNFKGKPVPVDTYYYIIELNNRTGSKPVTGFVTVFK